MPIIACRLSDSQRPACRLGPPSHADGPRCALFGAPRSALGCLRGLQAPIPVATGISLWAMGHVYISILNCEPDAGRFAMSMFAPGTLGLFGPCSLAAGAADVRVSLVRVA